MRSSTLGTGTAPSRHSSPSPDWAHHESVVWNLSKSNVRILLSHSSNFKGTTLNALVTWVNISEPEMQMNNYGVIRAIGRYWP